MIGINPTRGLETSLENVLQRFFSCINHPFFIVSFPIICPACSTCQRLSCTFSFSDARKCCHIPAPETGQTGICVFARNLMHRSEGSHVFRENGISQSETAARQILLTDCTADLPSFTSA